MTTEAFTQKVSLVRITATFLGLATLLGIGLLLTESPASSLESFSFAGNFIGDYLIGVAMIIATGYALRLLAHVTLQISNKEEQDGIEKPRNDSYAYLTAGLMLLAGQMFLAGSGDGWFLIGSMLQRGGLGLLLTIPATLVALSLITHLKPWDWSQIRQWIKNPDNDSHIIIVMATMNVLFFPVLKIALA